MAFYLYNTGTNRWLAKSYDRDGRVRRGEANVAMIPIPWTPNFKKAKSFTYVQSACDVQEKLGLVLGGDVEVVIVQVIG